MKLVRYFLPIYARQGRGLALALGLSALTVAAGVGLLGVAGWFLVGAALAVTSAGFNLLGPSSLVRGLSILRVLSRYGERIVGHDATLRLLAELRSWLFRRLIPLAPVRLGRLQGGDLVSRLTNDIDALDSVFLFSVAPFLTALAIGSGLALLLCLILPPAGLALALGLAAAVIGVPLLLAWRGMRPGTETAAAAARMRAAVLDGVEGHTDLVAFGAAEAAQERFAAAAAALDRARRCQARVAAGGQALLLAIAGLTLLTALWFGLGALEAKRIEPTVLAGLLFAILAVFEVAGPIMRGASRFGSAAAAARRIHALAETPPAVAEPPRPTPLPPDGGIEFSGVVFAHEGGRRVLDGLDLRVGAGERVAILGPSGSGKTTILRLLLRFDDVTGGSVRFAGCDVRDAALSDLHAHVAVLTQDSPVFLGTVRDNLLIGDPGADDASLYRALAAARLDTFVRELPEGLDSWVGEGGRTLSAGQARRLCLARTLLSPAPALLFDEPTSGLDPETERAFLSDLGTATRGRTVILVTHATLPACTVDRVYRLENGKLIEMPPGWRSPGREPS